MRARRVIVGVAVWSGAGVVASYLVAWAFAAWITPDRVNPVTFAPNPAWRTWSVEVPSGVPATLWRECQNNGERAGSVPWHAEGFSAPGLLGVSVGDGAAYGGTFQCTEYRHGWPFGATRVLCVSKEYLPPAGACFGPMFEVFPHSSVWLGGLGSGEDPAIVDKFRPDFRRLGIRPHWPGLLADAALYGLTLASVFHGVRAVRRWLNPGPGHCRGCGYRLAGLGVCPECGVPAGRGPARVRTAVVPRWPTVVGVFAVSAVATLPIAWLGSFLAERRAALVDLWGSRSMEQAPASYQGKAGREFKNGADDAWADRVLALYDRYGPRPPEPMTVRLAVAAEGRTLLAERSAVGCTMFSQERSDGTPVFGGVFESVMPLAAVHEVRAGFPWRAWGAEAVEDWSPAGLDRVGRGTVAPWVRAGSPGAGAFTVGDFKPAGAPPVVAAWAHWPTEAGFALPIRPIWGGLMGDAAVMAVGLLVVRGVWVLVVRLARRVRERCLACGYPVRGLNVCPECGAEVAGPTDGVGVGQ